VAVPVIEEDHPELVEQLTRQKGAPLGMHNEVETYLVARAVRREAKVVLCGEGADELFCGYGRIFRLPFEALASHPLLCGRLRGANSRAGTRAFDLLYERYSYFPQAEKKALFEPAVWQALDGDAMGREAIGRVFFQEPRASFFERIWTVFVSVHLQGLLGMVDAMTMAASVEARVPFLDAAVVDAASALPERDKLRWRRPWSRLRAFGRPASQFSEKLDIPKFALRRAYRDELPREVLCRRKQGFPVPLGSWYGGAKSERARALLLGREARLPSIARRAGIESVLDRARANADDTSGKRVLQLVSLEHFLRQHL
jgi:asparagine synthase (glutamine-hydrolysing)